MIGERALEPNLVKCPVCGKSFDVRDRARWRYRMNERRVKLYCSWTCFREAEKTRPGRAREEMVKARIERELNADYQ